MAQVSNPVGISQYPPHKIAAITHVPSPLAPISKWNTMHKGIATPPTPKPKPKGDVSSAGADKPQLHLGAFGLPDLSQSAMATVQESSAASPSDRHPLPGFPSQMKSLGLTVEQADRGPGVPFAPTRTIDSMTASYENTYAMVHQPEQHSVSRSRRLEPLSIPYTGQYEYNHHLRNPDIAQDPYRGPPIVPPRARRARQGTFSHGDEFSDSSGFSASTVRSQASWETSPSSTGGSPEVTQKPDILNMFPVREGGTSFPRPRAGPTPEPSTERNSSTTTGSSIRSNSSYPRAYTPPVHRGVIFAGSHPSADKRLLMPMSSHPRMRPVATYACDRLSNTELETIKAEIRDQAKGFAILSHEEASTLSNELQLLDARCEYMWNTYSSLREGRRSMHSRMIAYVELAETSNISRESILRQEEALMQLDSRVDAWIARLKRTETRRTELRQKLMEHITAILTIESHDDGESIYENVAEKRAPPRYPPPSGPLPARPKDPRRARGRENTESQATTVYDDPGVASLLNDIDHELGSIGDI